MYQAKVYQLIELTVNLFLLKIKLPKVQPSLQLSPVTEDWERGQDQEDHH